MSFEPRLVRRLGIIAARPQIPSAFLFLALCSAVAAGQDRLMIRDGENCLECSVRLARVVTLRGTDSVSFSFASKAIVNSRGEYIVAPTYTRGQIAILDGSGSLVRTIGRAGMGPGEIRGATFRLATGPGDSLHVLDVNRWMLFEPVSLDFKRLVTLRAAPTAFAITDHGNLLGAFAWQGQSGHVFTVNLVTAPGGEVVRSADILDPDGPGEPMSGVRHVAWAEESIWSVPVNAVRVRQERTYDGEQRLWVRDGGWFPPWFDLNVQEPFLARPRPRVTGLRVDTDFLWLFGVVADRNWRPVQLPPLAPGQERPRIRHIPPRSVFDGVIEVIDRRTGVVRARVVEDADWRPVGGSSDLVQATREEPSGEIVIDIYRVSFIR